MEDVVVLDWTFSPPDYFEEPIHKKYDDYEMIIGDGKVQVRIDPDAYNSDPAKRHKLHDEVTRWFVGPMLIAHKPYSLSEASICRLYRDGRRDAFIFPPAAVMVLRGLAPDIGDSRQKRIDRKRQLAELSAISDSADPVLKSILKSYDQAVKYPGNEFTHLYEVRDALTRKFGSEGAARSALGISSRSWSQFGRLTCKENLRQGRHRGEHIGLLRDATSEELDEVRGFAAALIENYMNLVRTKADS